MSSSGPIFDPMDSARSTAGESRPAEISQPNFNLIDTLLADREAQSRLSFPWPDGNRQLRSLITQGTSDAAPILLVRAAAEGPMANPEVTLALRYGQADFDRQLTENPRAAVIKLNGVPETVAVRFWKDNKGYFFWFQNGNDNRARHYYSRELRFIEINGRRLDVRAEERNVERATVQQELKYGDADFDRKLVEGYKRVKITGLPPGVKLRHWADEKGYYFWFENGNDNKRRHYYSSNLFELEIGGQKQNVDLERLKVNQALVSRQSGLPSGFGSMTRRTRDLDYGDVMIYAARMSRISADVLNTQERILREHASSSTNPYFLSLIHI